MQFSVLIWSLAVILFLGLLYRRRCSPLAHLPGPEISKWTELISIYYWLTGRNPYYVHYLHERYGPIVRVSPEEVDICDLDAVKEIHTTGGRFLKSEFYRNMTLHFTLRIDGFLVTPISDSSLTSFEPTVAGKVRLAVERMTEEMSTRGAMDVFTWWIMMATGIIGELSFGESFRMLESEKKNQYILDIEQTSSRASIKVTFPSLVLLGSFIPLPFFRKVAEAGKRMASHAQQSIDRYHSLLDASGPESSPKPTLFTKLYSTGKGGLSNEEIRNEAHAYIVGGSDTTAITLTYLVYEVCKDANIRARLVDEVASLPEDFTDRITRDLPYLKQVIHETLRLHTVVQFGLPRIVPPGGAEHLGYRLPGGVTVATQAYSLHRREDIFPDPYRFNPDRWEETTKLMKHAFLPFGRGSRVCIGMHLARIELRLVTVMFFRAFPRARISTKEGMADEDMKMKCFFLMAPQGHRCLIEA